MISAMHFIVQFTQSRNNLSLFKKLLYPQKYEFKYM